MPVTSRSIVTMAVVDVWEMQVPVREGFVNVRVGMWIPWRVIRCMGMVVVSVVSVGVGV